MKTLLIMCGAGHATSTVVRSKMEAWLNKEGLANEVTIKQSSVGAEVQNISAGKYDVVVSTTQVPAAIKDKVIMGLGLLTGFGADAVFANIKEQLKK